MSFVSRNHPQQVRARGPLEAVDDRGTTWADYMAINREFGPFTLDVAASDANSKCPRHYTIHDNGLTQTWAGERVWCNPPYSDIGPWVAKAWAEHAAHTIAMLLPANRCEQRWWQDLVEPYRDNGHGLTTRFLPGRMRFTRPGVEIGPKGDRPPFGCVLLVWAHE